jgi:hypothetical protein
MQKIRMPLAVLMTAALVLTGCSEDDPTGPSSTELDAVQAALINSGAMSFLGAFAPFAFAEGVTPTSIDITDGTAEAFARAAVAAQTAGYDAFGVQLVIDATFEGDPVSESFTGLVAWTGLDVEEETVDKSLTLLGAGEMGAGSSRDMADDNYDPVAETGGFAIFIDNQLQDIFYNSTGTFSVSAISFGSPTTGTGVTMGSLAYTAAVGSMSGSFTLGMANIGQTSTMDLASTFSGLPAVKVTITGTYPR